MAPRKKKQPSKRRDESPEPTLKEMGIRLSPARTPKKLLRNKKRKELIESLTPSTGKSGKPKQARTPSSNSKGKSSSLAQGNSILSYFARAEPVKHVECPMCTSQVPMSKINQHLDSNCGNAVATSQNDSDVVVVLDSNDEGEIKKPSIAKKGRKTKSEASSLTGGRKKVDLKTDKKDKRNRLRLKKKIASHVLYQSGDSSVIEASESEASNLEDIELVKDVKNKKGAHRALFSEEDKDLPSCSGMTSKLSRQKDSAKRNVSGKKRAASTSGAISPYWQQSGGASDDCIVVSSTPPRASGLSPTTTQQFSPLKRIKLSPSSSSSVSTSSNKNHNIQLKSPEKHSQTPRSLLIQSHPDEQHLPRSPYTSKSSPRVNITPNTSPRKHQTPTGTPHYASTNRLPHTPNRTSIRSPMRSQVSSPSNRLPRTPNNRTPLSSPMRSQVSSPALSTGSRNSYNSSPSKREPYYLVNFKLILLSVLGNEDDKSLFNEEDMTYISLFQALSGRFNHRAYCFLLVLDNRNT